MLSKKLWEKIKKKLVELPAKIRVKELEVLKVQAADNDVLKEIKDLLEKAKLELQSIPWRERGGAISLGSRIQLTEDEFVQKSPRALEEAVANVPVPEQLPLNEPEIIYGTAEGYASGEGYISKGYESPASALEKQAAEARETRTVDDIRENFGNVSPSEYTKRMTKR